MHRQLQTDGHSWYITKYMCGSGDEVVQQVVSLTRLLES